MTHVFFFSFLFFFFGFWVLVGGREMVKLDGSCSVVNKRATLRHTLGKWETVKADFMNGC